MKSPRFGSDTAASTSSSLTPGTTGLSRSEAIYWSVSQVPSGSHAKRSVPTFRSPSHVKTRPLRVSGVASVIAQSPGVAGPTIAREV